MYQKKEKNQKAQEFYTKCIELNPSNVNALIGLGIEKRKEEKYKEAIRYFTKALQIDPEFDLIWENLSLVYYGLEDFRKAEQCRTKFKQLGESQKSLDTEMVKERNRYFI